MQHTNMKTIAVAALLGTFTLGTSAQDQPDCKPADMTKPVQVFILMGQSNMVGLGKVGGPGRLAGIAVKEKKKYPYLVDDAGNWTERKDVRYVRVMVRQAAAACSVQQRVDDRQGRKTIGPEFGIGHPLGNAVEAPVMILKSCIGNRSLGWDLLPPGSERYEFVVQGQGGRGKEDGLCRLQGQPRSWELDPAKGLKTEPGPWVDKNRQADRAGMPASSGTTTSANAKTVLVRTRQALPRRDEVRGRRLLLLAGREGRRQSPGTPRTTRRTSSISSRRCARTSMPRTRSSCSPRWAKPQRAAADIGGEILDAQLAVDGTSGKYPEFKGNVATVYTNPMAQGGSGNGHYGGNAEVYMDVGEAMGKAMVELLKGGK